MADQTVTELIKSALRKCGAVASGETPNNAEMQDALIALRIMLRSWSAKSLMLFKNTVVSHALSSGTTSYTIGSGATISAVRPVRINSAYVSSGGLDYPVNVIDEKQYANIHDKTDANNWPKFLWYNPTYSQGIIYVWPAGAGTLYMNTMVPLTDPTTLTEDVVFPGEYDAAIVWNLACEMMPEYGREPTPYQMARAVESKDMIVALNCALAMGEAELGIERFNYQSEAPIVT